MSKLLKKKYCYGMVFSHVLSLFFLSSAHAISSEQFDYPELSVVPRASDRIQTESHDEANRSLVTFLPLEVSAVSTFVAGIASYDPGRFQLFTTGAIVGGGWLLTSLFLSLTYRPYSEAARELSQRPSSTERDKLSKERAAEEFIHSGADAGSHMKWISFLTNFGASFYLLSQAQNPASTAYAGIAVGLSLMPIVFPFHWNRVQTEQEEYKKRIYSPIASLTLLPDLNNHTYVPGLAFLLAF